VTSLESTTSSSIAATRPPKLMDAVVKQPWSVAELESYVGTLSAADVEKQYVFYDWLASAYINNGRAEAEIARRAPAVLAGSASRKDITVWLSLASEQPDTKAVELAAQVDAGSLTVSTLTGYPRLLLARLYAKAGRRDEAVEHYSAVVTEVLAGAANTMPYSSIVADAYGRDNQLMLFTGIGLFDEMRAHLDAAGLAQVVTTMVDLTKPVGTPSLDQWFARFALILNARAREAGVTIPALHEAAGALPVVEAWPRAETLHAAAARARIGKLDDALRILQMTLRRDLDVRQPLVSSISTIATRQYQIALGLVGDTTMLGPFGPVPMGIEEFKPLFPATADAWPGAREWVAGAARSIPDWITAGSISRDAGVQLLSLLVLRLHQMGDAAGVASAAAPLTALLRDGLVSLRTASIASAVTDTVNVPLDLALLQGLVRENRLHVSRVTRVLARTAEVEGPDRALALGETAAQFTSADELLRQLVAIARSADNTAEVEKWTARQRAASAARAALAGRPAR
jgi:hypothetical protein